MPALGIDIGSYSIKAVAADVGRRGVTVSKVIEVPNSMGFTVPTDDTQAEKCATVIQTFLNDSKLPQSDVRLSLPESVVSTKVISIPPLTDGELASAIGWQAEQHIPIPPEDLSLEYQVLFRPGRKEKVPMRVLLVGTRKQLVERYVGVFHSLGIEPTVVETHSISLLRSLKFTIEDPPTLVAHIGSATMQLMAVKAGELQFVVSNSHAGQVLTRSLEQGVGLDAQQAEEYKRQFGLDESQFQGKLKEALVPGVRVIVAEIKKALQFFANQNSSQSIQRVVLSGGSAALPGLVQMVATELGCEVLLAAPFASVQGEIPTTVTPAAFCVCMGMVLRSS